MNSPKKKKNKRRFTVIMSALLTVSVVILNIVFELTGKSGTVIQMIKGLHIGIIDMIFLAVTGAALLVIRFINRKGK
ncbi:MAG TPA: hypothetical protein DCS38_00440 [Ruminococcus sp.]|nr:hypothetical protein [Ruminococcus sp.]HBN10876.1 hypothetical protein [Ruminococcus sp.]HCR73977.1 hypothetical protein [Ruminococcus sp.]